MPEHTLTVPAEYAEDFRAAIVEEIATDTQWVREQRKDLGEAIERKGSNVDMCRVDLRGSQRHLEQDADLLRQVGFDAEGDLKIPIADASVLAHVCENMARDIIGPRVQDALGIGPMDARQATELRRLVKPLAWAFERAAELHARAADERREEVA